MKTTTLLLALVPALFLTSCYVTPAGGPYNNNRGGYNHRGHDHDRDRRDNDRDRYDRDRVGRGPSGTYRRSSSSRPHNPVFPFGA
ncbi:hypothetical protein [Prosthecobacter sp. SYSU 5D2]|uniref:hypothetical protein n=1 Tax=Prosthecobacter sp. SYSU 5D2 TaxID=3134134 RepID=UPI0031FEF928